MPVSEALCVLKVTGCCSSQEQILILSAVAEIAAGFMLLLLAVQRPWKFLVLAIFYCGAHLPARCHMPESAAYHNQVCALSHCSVCRASTELL